MGGALRALNDIVVTQLLLNEVQRVKPHRTQEQSAVQPGAIEVREREVGRAELGVSPDQLARSGEMLLAVKRGDHVYRFNTDGLRVLQKGDTIVTIRHGHRAPRKSEFDD